MQTTIFRDEYSNVVDVTVPTITANYINHIRALHSPRYHPQSDVPRSYTSLVRSGILVEACYSGSGTRAKLIPSRKTEVDFNDCRKLHTSLSRSNLKETLTGRNHSGPECVSALSRDVYYFSYIYEKDYKTYEILELSDRRNLAVIFLPFRIFIKETTEQY